MDKKVQPYCGCYCKYYCLPVYQSHSLTNLACCIQGHLEKKQPLYLITEHLIRKVCISHYVDAGGARCHVVPRHCRHPPLAPQSFLSEECEDT